MGLDHVSFTVSSREELEKTARVLDERKVPYGEIVDLAPFQIYVLMFCDSGNIQVEPPAPYG